MMKRTLPEYDIKGTTFIVDVVKMELREKENLSNVLSFGAMYDYRTYYILDYDPVIKNSRPKDYSPPSKDRQKGFLLVPQMCELDPVGVAEMYGLSIEQVKGKCDYELWLGVHGKRHRIEMNWYPMLDIDGVAHDVHLEIGRIHLQGDRWDLGISLLHVPEEQLRYTFYYNVKALQQYFPKPNIKVLPKDVYQITIPGPARLDPVWLARKHRVSPETYLKRYPLVMYRKAELIPLEKTELAKMVKNNLEKKNTKQHKRKP